MRGSNDRRSAVEYKEASMLDLVKRHGAMDVVVFDDDFEGDCAPMYTRNGWLHLKVMDNVVKLTLHDMSKESQILPLSNRSK